MNIEIFERHGQHVSTMQPTESLDGWILTRARKIRKNTIPLSHPYDGAIIPESIQTDRTSLIAGGSIYIADDGSACYAMVGLIHERSASPWHPVHPDSINRRTDHRRGTSEQSQKHLVAHPQIIGLRRLPACRGPANPPGASMLFAEGQWRYVESSRPMRMFLDKVNRPTSTASPTSPRHCHRTKESDSHGALDRRHGDRSCRSAALALRQDRQTGLP